MKELFVPVVVEMLLLTEGWLWFGRFLMKSIRKGNRKENKGKSTEEDKHKISLLRKILLKKR
jgi:hypothetical protein